MGKKPTKWHNGAESREMARADNWVMVRRPRAAPYVIPATEWDALPSVAEGRMLADRGQALKGGE